MALCATGAGLLIGSARLRAIDAGASSPPAGSSLAVRGWVTAVPRRSEGVVRVRIETGGGRLAVEVPEPVPDLPVGAELRAAGTIRPPPAWLRDNLRMHGIDRVLHARHVMPTGRWRGGIEGRIDRLRRRAEEALGRGMPDAQAALARGFVLGQDDRIPKATIEAFQRSGLAHLLAVSGQNIVLLALLAWPLLAALGIPLRTRLVWLLVLIALYVPLAGGGASIQRAGAMGAAGVVATLAGRPASRAYALLLAVVATLAVNPRFVTEVGWQLSFAAVVGIFAWAAPLRDLLVSRLGAGGWQRGLADGMAITIAATLATAPLMAHHFETLSLTALPANVLALPAVAPAMWLGMLVVALGQAPAVPVEPLNWLNSLLLAYIGQVADWAAAPRWALLEVRIGSWPALLAAYAALFAAGLALRRWLAERAGLRLPTARGVRAAALVAALASLLVAVPWLDPDSSSDAPADGLRVAVLDVGQGDAILLQPAGAEPLLVDAGPVDAAVADRLDDFGVHSLAAAVVTHDQADHAGGVPELLESVPVRRLVFATAGRHLIAAARGAGTIPTRVAEGGELRAGALRLEALWPPRELLESTPDDPNAASLVLLARWHRFEMLLSGDAEAEAVPLDPGPLDVLKVSHHGSADAGLAELLHRTAPRLAVISVGEDNPFGHPDRGVLSTLATQRVPVLRTDRAGTIVINVTRRGMRVGAHP